MRGALGTFGCYVNGELWVPNINNRFFSRRIEANYYSPLGNFSISGTKRLDEEGISQAISFGCYSLFSSGEINLVKSSLYLNHDTTFCAENEFLIDTTLVHQMKILRFDSEAKIISGTFEFTATNEYCDPVVITDGRFDIRY